jgi:polysaccharide export outer membrane protein
MRDLPPNKEVVIEEGDLIPYDIEDYQLQYNDIVDITLRTTSPELNQILMEGVNEFQMRNLTLFNSGDVFFLNGFAIDDEGYVDLPLIGEVKLVGLNVREAKLVLEKRMEKYVNKDNYYVRVRLGGIRYSVIGEFNRPGKYTILQNRVTIFEAIANAGDMTSLAKRNEVLIIRQYPEGSKTFTIDLLNEKIKESEFFYVRPNDLIFAKPKKKKSWGTGITFAETLTLILAIVTVVLLYVNVTD